jgi:hypothetical protein
MVTVGQRIAWAARTTKLANATNIWINDGGAAFRAVPIGQLPRRRASEGCYRQRELIADGATSLRHPRPGVGRTVATDRCLRHRSARVR